MAARIFCMASSLTCRTSSLTQVSRHLRTTTVLGSRSADGRLAKLAQAEVDEMEAQGITLPHPVRTAEHGAIIRLEETGDKDILDFSKNSYLGLACHPDVVKAARDAVDEFGVGIGNVRAGHGTFTLHKQLEKELTDFLDRDPEHFDTCVFPTGYHANLALFHRLVGPEDVIISDTLIHGTAIHGMALSKAKTVVFKHNDMEDLEKMLQANMDKRQRVIAADGVYSMQGYCALLQEMRVLADKYDALLMIDDAHGIGVVGEHGKGAEDYMNAMNSCDIITASLCKGLTPAGGFILANRPFVQMLRNRSGSYVFSTALTPSNTAAVLKALEIARGEEGYARRANIRRLSKLFRQLMGEAGFVIDGDEEMPICPVIFAHDPPYVLNMAKEVLNNFGILTIGVTVPSAPPEAPRIRVTLAGFHKEEHVRRLVDAFIASAKKLGKTR